VKEFENIGYTWLLVVSRKMEEHELWSFSNALFFIITTWFINTLCFYLSPVALFVILFYSYTKRFTPLCHFVLSLGLAIAPMGAYLAVAGRFDWLPLMLRLVVFFWVSGFDIIYALQDEDFDKNLNLKYYLKFLAIL
jgi:4-hydroxybenzoate polyprenyltransferase